MSLESPIDHSTTNRFLRAAILVSWTLERVLIMRSLLLNLRRKH